MNTIQKKVNSPDTYNSNEPLPVFPTAVTSTESQGPRASDLPDFTQLMGEYPLCLLVRSVCVEGSAEVKLEENLTQAIIEFLTSIDNSLKHVKDHDQKSNHPLRPDNDRSPHCVMTWVYKDPAVLREYESLSNERSKKIFQQQKVPNLKELKLKDYTESIGSQDHVIYINSFDVFDRVNHLVKQLQAELYILTACVDILKKHVTLETTFRWDNQLMLSNLVNELSLQSASSIVGLSDAKELKKVHINQLAQGGTLDKIGFAEEIILDVVLQSRIIDLSGWPNLKRVIIKNGIFDGQKVILGKSVEYFETDFVAPNAGLDIPEDGNVKTISIKQLEQWLIIPTSVREVITSQRSKHLFDLDDFENKSLVKFTIDK